MYRKILTILALTIAATAFKCSYKGIDPNDYPNGGIKISTKVQQVTPNGAGVFSEKGVSQPRLEAIDFELEQVFQDAKNSGYTEHVGDYGFYQFYVPLKGCMLSREQRIPSFLLRADAYDGTDYDQYNPEGVHAKDGIGIIFAAEMVLDVGTPQSTPAIGQAVVCDSDIIGTAARNGVEHILAAQPGNDPNYYVQTIGPDHQHPLLPHPITQALFATNSPEGKLIVPVK